MLVAFLIASTMAGAEAPSAATTPPDPRPKEKKDDSRIVCQRETELGSHQVVKECHTVAEWKAIRDESRRSLQGISGNGDLAKPDAGRTIPSG